ncbi:MAG: hypothetical protein ACYCY2_05655 [Acidithiobacillus ferriphilus]
MSKIFLANTSRKDWLFNFRSKEVPLFTKNVPSGKQDEINIDAAHTDKVIACLRQFGAIHRDELSQHSKNYEGLVYSTDKPLQINQFHYGHDELIDQAESRSVVEASKAAMAGDLILNPRNRDRMTGASEAEFEEEVPMRGQKKKTMKITVDPEAGRSDKMQLQ